MFLNAKSRMPWKHWCCGFSHWIFSELEYFKEADIGGWILGILKNGKAKLEFESSYKEIRNLQTNGNCFLNKKGETEKAPKSKKTIYWKMEKIKVGRYQLCNNEFGEDIKWGHFRNKFGRMELIWNNSKRWT